MARLVQVWGSQLEQFSKFHNLGVVVGATFPEELKSVRNIVKNSFILLPGFGAQGATASDIRHGFNQNGLGGIVNSSRGIIYAYFKNEKYPPSKFGEAARDKITEMNQTINKEIFL
jgi:orotidine-5'-phosphate decarboxylase